MARGHSYGKGLNEEIVRGISDEALLNDPNPDFETIRQAAVNVCYESITDLTEPANWLTVPWNPDKKIRMHHLFRVLVSPSDYHDRQIPEHLFPVDESLEFIDRVIERRKHVGKSVTIPQQFKIAMDITDGYPIAAALVAHSASRAIARNLDTRTDPRLEFSQEQMKEWAKSVATFPHIHRVNEDAVGDNYHFWAYFSMGAATRATDAFSSVYAGVWNMALLEGGQILDFVRRKATHGRSPLLFKHAQIGEHAQWIGWGACFDMLHEKYPYVPDHIIPRPRIKRVELPKTEHSKTDKNQEETTPQVA